MKSRLLFISLLLSFIFVGCTNSVNPKDEANTPSQRLIIPFQITEQNNIKFKALLNGVDSVEFYFDTGGTELVMKHEAITTNTTLLDGKNSNYTGEDYDPLEEENTLTMGGITWDSLSIYPVGVGPDMDGHFGWDLFEGMIIELDYEKEQLTIHESLPANFQSYSKLPIEYTHTLFCIKASVDIGDSTYTNRYLFDTGFQRAVVMDKDLRAKSNFPTNLPSIKESTLRNSAGDVFINQVVMVDQLCFGNECANEIPVQLFETPNPARFETHILGGELLKRFNTILDFKDHFVYMKPNSLLSMPYMDMQVNKRDSTIAKKTITAE